MSTRMLIRGWRGINHSYALVNQYQIAELSKVADLQLFHEDLPFISPAWSREENAAGFDAETARRIDAVPPPDGAPVDIAYSIGAPLVLYRGLTRRNATFIVTEFGLDPASLSRGGDQAVDFTAGDNLVITPSQWARGKLIACGMGAGGIRVVPHGVDQRIFNPHPAALREQVRKGLGFRADEFVLLNIGGNFWNKGIDLLVLAFAILRRRYPQLRLMLKDNRKLYGTTSDDLIGRITAQNPQLIDDSVRAAIVTIPNTLDLPQLSALYNAVDCYVSPYRAEGFNMPVLEAMACGLPVLVTQGGATDDFFTSQAGALIESRLVRQSESALPVGGDYLEPSLEDLVAKLEAAVRAGRVGERASAVDARRSWAAVSEELLVLLQQ